MKKDYEKACNAYLRAFCNKHGFEYEPDAWVAGEVGGITCVSDYYVDMRTIITDMESNAPEAEFMKWYDYCLRAGSLGCVTPNFKSWLAGCPVKSEAELEKFEKLHHQIEKLKEEFERTINKK
jgi:hypothetical protein